MVSHHLLLRLDYAHGELYRQEQQDQEINHEISSVKLLCKRIDPPYRRGHHQKTHQDLGKLKL